MDHVLRNTLEMAGRVFGVPFITAVHLVDLELGVHDVGMVAALVPAETLLRLWGQLGITIPVLNLLGLTGVLGLPARLKGGRRNRDRESRDLWHGLEELGPRWQPLGR